MDFPNIVTKFKNIDIFDNFVRFFTCRLFTPAAWTVLILHIEMQFKSDTTRTHPKLDKCLYFVWPAVIKDYFLDQADVQYEFVLIF